MKVQIQYHIAVDEVPNKISQLIEEALTVLQKQIDTMQTLNELCKQGSHLDVVESGIDTLRKQLVTTDTALADAYSICAGLVAHLNPEPPAEPPNPEPSAEPPEPTMVEEEETSNPVEKK